MLTTPYKPPPSNLQYRAQLDEFDALLSSLRNARTASIPLSGVFLSPRPHSALAQEHDIAQAHLKKLLDHPDYLALLHAKTGGTTTLYLAVTLNEGKVEYEAADANNLMVPLPVSDQQSLEDLATALKHCLVDIGGQLRSDRLLRLPQILGHYGLQPAKPQTDATLDSLIKELNEMRASFSLGLDSTMDFGDFIEKSGRRSILDVLSFLLAENETSVIESLGKETLLNIPVDQLRATPATFLERILNGNNAQWLAQKLLDELRWYGARPHEEVDSGIKKRLVLAAIRCWYSLTDDKPDDTVIRFRLEQPSNWGKSYHTLRSEFETYLIDSGNVSTTNEAILLARLLQPQLPAEFQVRDIPQELPYRSSIVWVNFAHGVNLAKAIDRTLISRMTFQQLVDFPIKKSAGASPELLDLIALTRIRPTLDWASTNGFLNQQPENTYTKETILLATHELITQTNLLNESITCLAAPTPNRLTIAKSKLTKIFGSGTFNADHTKLVEEANEYLVNPIRHGGPIQRARISAYTFVDVYASGNIYNGKRWFFTDGVTVSDKWISVNEQKIVSSNAIRPEHKNKSIKLPDVKNLFKASFNIHLFLQRIAYQKLILSQLATLPWADRLALEYGEIRILTLRTGTGRAAGIETPAMTLPLRARKGFILAVKHDSRHSYYELLPSAGIIRPLPDFSERLIGGVLGEGFWGNARVMYLDPISVPFDWDAHTRGTQPRVNQTCMAIIDQIGETFSAQKIGEDYTPFPCTLKSPRLNELTHFISHTLFFVDEEHYRNAALDETKYDKEQKIRDKVLNITKIIVPFWSSIEDLASGDAKRIKDGFLGIFIDVAAFLFPIGKFASGSMRLVSISGKLGIRATLPSFLTLTKKLLITTLNNLNPIDGIPTLLAALGAGVSRLGKFGFSRLKELAGRAGQYDFVQGLPQATDPGRWSPLAAGDRLGSVNDIEDVVLRRTNTGPIASYHPVDPHSGKPYGPRLTEDEGGVSIGRSEFPPAGEIDNRVVFDIPENARVSQIPELNSRTGLVIDGVQYRLDRGSLKRVDTLDASQELHLQPCRVRRAGDQVCVNSYVSGTPQPTPAPKSNDPEEYYCPWFGDRIYTPAPATSTRKEPILALDGQLYTGTGDTLSLSLRKRTEFGLPKKRTPKARVDATIEFKKGMYGRIIVKGADEGVDDIRQVGTLIIESKIDPSKEYLFTQLNVNDYYFAEINKGTSLEGTHRLQLATQTLKNAQPKLFKELSTVFDGSLYANNMAAFYGIERIEEATRTMNKIAVSIGGMSKPADNMTTIKVATTPGEAVMFDRETRMIVCKYPQKTKVWTRTNDAPPQLRQRTAEIFNQLFNRAAPKPNTASIVQISSNMADLQRIVRKHKSMDNPRNIAYAEVTHPDKTIEVFVSVSGGGGDTRFLPIFRKDNTFVKEVTIDKTTYINIDHNVRFERESLSNANGQFQAIPRISMEFPPRPTSLDSESKLIKVIREKYPDDATRSPVTIATTMPPCESCSVVMQQFAHTGGPDALKVVWD
ncbi:hypothetical protein [Pseudomonas moraviensis]|uniref:Deaminase n=1 Tax=Pseudomonas moraviensis TaxID=321662 RepID=A0A7Z0AVX5_9PSED|nr:hypothetical protein [Pseudomonas moraviensis]NYH10627.1 hypothetical protein [Pseudomonas moraviensis]